MIGKYIYEIRKSKGLTLTELADRAGIAKSYLSNIERSVNKNPSINVVEKIANVLDIDVRMLLNSSVDQKSIQLDEEWVNFARELKESGVDKEQFAEYKTLLEFIKWKNRNDENN
ncbi:helix-turn-helix domain-containing protein [Lederbergia wuyishanensis]|uniref:XRE family transcriptional regulator of biofilm formation n=1 Tax=Lederbergia wuyishanensis TaxID=1347903 RepID=A0ABU0D7S6_9BACI|nr:XRE family transcriptional regulator [Lederbergia wuyishanensis]MCJ8009127.1 helix-turn-helix domain-containing protein [Lederbergia wuyishanensis]MDQ0344466.1 XRE family transcriptional regulator of biofilm formation [Lederbergia wuyishanensis]